MTKRSEDKCGTYIGFAHHMEQVQKLKNEVEYYSKQRNEFAASYEATKEILVEAIETLKDMRDIIKNPQKYRFDENYFNNLIKRANEATKND